MLNILWIGFILSSALAACYQLFINGDQEVFSRMVNSTFSMSKTAFELSLGLTGVMSLWLGIMKIGEKGGVIAILTKLVGPIMSRFFPQVPKDHPAMGTMMLNISANMLGIDNAATPFGLKAMKQLQELNTSNDKASSAQIMFLVINTSAVTIIPVSIFTYLYQLNYPNPTDIFIPILIATFCSTIGGVTLTSFIQKIPLIKSGIIFILAGAAVVLGTFTYFLLKLPQQEMQSFSLLISNMLIFGVIVLFVSMAAIKKVNVYEAFIEGAKDGFQIAISIIPYLIAMLVAIGIFRSSGLLELFIEFIRFLFVSCYGLFSTDTPRLEFIDALPTILLKPLSGSGARAMMVETIKTHGVDSLVSKMVAVVQGSTETTFYVLAVYFGSVGIKKTGHAVFCGLFADLCGATAAIVVSYLFFT